MVAILASRGILHSMMKKRYKTNRFQAVRAAMAEYGFPLRLVMCGKVVNGRFYLTHKTK
jgi:hypothetical protein